VALRLDQPVRREIETLLASNSTPLYALALIQSARWHTAISAATAPWQIAPSGRARPGASPLPDCNLNAPAQRPALAAHATNAPLSLAETFHALRLLDELKHRAADPNDPLTGLSRYTLLFRLRGAPMNIFRCAEHLFRQRDYPRAQRLFRFLISPANPIGFTIGNSHHFLGHVYYFQRKELDQAFVHFLSVQRYPACLVYTAYAYIHAAAILKKMNMPVHALALLAVDVPCIDYVKAAFTRHMRSAFYRLELQDHTNAVRHLQTALALLPARSNDVLDCCSLIPGAPAIWDAVATQRWCAADATAAIEAALTNRWDTPDDQLFLDALLHDWPAQEDIPLHIATNRVLNNNIFPRRVRAVRGLNHLTQGE
jgi:tetratricopeptide (TPR) repeat protein